MEEGRIVFDASAYMLFEASGDSEAACNSDAAFQLDSDAAAEDDAQSCSYGSFFGGGERRPPQEFVDSGGDIRGVEFDYFSGEEDDAGDGGSDEEEDGVVDQCRRRAAAEQTKSKGVEESKLMMSERERDRLFWEACLAS